MRLSLPALALLAASALPAAAQDHDDHIAELEGLRIVDAWARPVAESLEIFVRIENAGTETARLVGGTAFGVPVSIVASPVRAGGGVPETLEAMEVVPGVEMAFEPRGLYLLAQGATAQAEGEAEMVLRFEPQGEVEVHVEIAEPGATEHPDGPHNH